MGILTGKKNMQVLIERYVGGNHKEFQVIEAELAKIVAIIKKNFPVLKDRSVSNLVATKGGQFLNESDHNKLIEKMITKFFGLKGFNLIWINNGMPNAMTPCRTFTFNDPDPGQDNRYKNKDITIATIVDVGLVTYCDLNEKELFAIILHEIGHNFYNSIFQLLSRLPISLPVLAHPAGLGHIISSLIQIVTFDAIGPEIYGTIYKNIDTFMYKNFPKIYGALNLYKEMMFNFLEVLKIKNIILIAKYAENILLYNTLSTHFIFGYNAEKFSDNFAVDHGYGIHLATAMDKLEKKEKTLSMAATKDIPGVNWIVDLVNLQFAILISFLDEHPGHSIRIRSGLDRLRQQSKDPKVDPKIRKELVKQLKDYEKYYNDVYLNVDENNNKKRIFSYMYKYMVDKIFAGKLDLRELTYALDPHKYK